MRQLHRTCGIWLELTEICSSVRGTKWFDAMAIYARLACSMIEDAETEEFVTSWIFSALAALIVEEWKRQLRVAVECGQMGQA